MRANRIQPISEERTFNDNIDYPIFNDELLNGGSQIIEPDVITPIKSTGSGNVVFNPEEVIDIVLAQQNSGTGTTTSGQTNSGQTAGTSSIKEPATEVVPSATTGGTKTYVDGGTTPDSDIVVDKPKPNYLVFGLIGLVGAYVVYKVFFQKKSE
jgi:hypothetical protein